MGNAGIVAEGVSVKLSGLAANGASGVFPNWGAAAGSHDWLYWVVPVHAKFGEGIPLPAGYALTNGSGSVKGMFPKIAGASSYKILRIDWDQHSVRPYPEGTGKYLATTVQQESCATLTCSVHRCRRRTNRVHERRRKTCRRTSICRGSTSGREQS